MAKNMGGYRDYGRDINDPIRIERRMKLAHYLGLIELEEELWKQLQKVNEMTSITR